MKLTLLKFIKERMPSPEEVQQYRYIHIFGDTLKQPELWVINRSNIANGFAIGVFCAFLPMPFEMLAAVFIAAMIGGNLPISISVVWISNPVTWIPMYTPCYLLGAKILGVNPIPLDQITILQVGWHYVALWLGSLIVGSTLAVSTHFVVSYLWAANVRQRWQHRKQTRLARKQQANKQQAK